MSRTLLYLLGVTLVSAWTKSDGRYIRLDSGQSCASEGHDVIPTEQECLHALQSLGVQGASSSHQPTISHKHNNRSDRPAGCFEYRQNNQGVAKVEWNSKLSSEWKDASWVDIFQICEQSHILEYGATDFGHWSDWEYCSSGKFVRRFGTKVQKGRDHVDVHAGSSGSNTKTVIVSLSGGGGFLKCPFQVTKNNWLGDEQYNDKFKVEVFKYGSGSNVKVTRTDENLGWGMDLKFRCIVDNTGVMGVKLVCENNKHLNPVPASAAIGVGKWSSTKTCNGNKYMSGGMSYSTTYQGSSSSSNFLSPPPSLFDPSRDEKGMGAFDMKCGDDIIKAGNGEYGWSNKKEERDCPPGTYVRGIQVKLKGTNSPSNYDDTGVNRVRLSCKMPKTDPPTLAPIPTPMPTLNPTYADEPCDPYDCKEDEFYFPKPGYAYKKCDGRCWKNNPICCEKKEICDEIKYTIEEIEPLNNLETGQDQVESRSVGTFVVNNCESSVPVQLTSESLSSVSYATKNTLTFDKKQQNSEGGSQEETSESSSSTLWEESQTSTEESHWEVSATATVGTGEASPVQAELSVTGSYGQTNTESITDTSGGSEVETSGSTEGSNWNTIIALSENKQESTTVTTNTGWSSGISMEVPAYSSATVLAIVEEGRGQRSWTGKVECLMNDNVVETTELEGEYDMVNSLDVTYTIKVERCSSPGFTKLPNTACEVLDIGEDYSSFDEAASACEREWQCHGVMDKACDTQLAWFLCGHMDSFASTEFGHCVFEMNDKQDPPTAEPTYTPTPVPSHVPTHAPTEFPTPVPTQNPTHLPTPVPSHVPTHAPTEFPTPVPTQNPTHLPTPVPTEAGLDCPGISNKTPCNETEFCVWKAQHCWHPDACELNKKKKKCKKVAHCAWDKTLPGGQKCFEPECSYYTKKKKCNKNPNCAWDSSASVCIEITGDLADI